MTTSLLLPVIILAVIVIAVVLIAVKKPFLRHRNAASKETQLKSVNSSAQQQEKLTEQPAKQSKQTVKCSSCGANNKLGCYFCEHCGKKL